MTETKPIIHCEIIKRYKRFLADVRFADGRLITVHCPNPGRMSTCWKPGWPAIISDSENPKRKLRYTLEMIHNGTCWIGINTHKANDLAEEAVQNGVITELGEYNHISREIKYGMNSRIDLLLQNPAERCYVEVKNVTLLNAGNYQFPDAVTARGLKHLHELMQVKQAGHRAVMLFVIQRSDGRFFEPARQIDPAYAAGLMNARGSGVEILCYRADVRPEKSTIVEKIPFQI